MASVDHWSRQKMTPMARAEPKSKAARFADSDLRRDVRFAEVVIYRQLFSVQGHSCSVSSRNAGGSIGLVTCSLKPAFSERLRSSNMEYPVTATIGTDS